MCSCLPFFFKVFWKLFGFLPVICRVILYPLYPTFKLIYLNVSFNIALIMVVCAPSWCFKYLLNLIRPRRGPSYFCDPSRVRLLFWKWSWPLMAAYVVDLHNFTNCLGPSIFWICISSALVGSVYIMDWYKFLTHGGVRSVRELVNF